MESRYNKKGRKFHSETLALGLGYDAFLSEGAIKPPVFMTSTFKFKTAEEGKHFFDLVYGNVKPKDGEQTGLVYSRLNNPNLQIFEERISAWDYSDMGAVFSSGMSAISTTMFTFLKPGDHIITTMPVYGGTYFLFENILPKYGIITHAVHGGEHAPRLIREKIDEVGAEKVKMLYLETPANPSNLMTDIKRVVEIANELNNEREEKVLTVVDNTFLGPLFQRPSRFGVDLNIYSATKFIGGHSDLIAGVVTGKKDLVTQVTQTRTILGTQTTAYTGWLLIRSLETLSIRMRRQAKNAMKLAAFLAKHEKVKEVFYPGLLPEESEQKKIYEAQCTGPGSLIAFSIEGGEAEAFKVLNNFEIFGLAVSLGGTESLVEHPASMTHSDISPEEQRKFGILPNVIRVSVGIEHIEDLIEDMEFALSAL